MCDVDHRGFGYSRDVGDRHGRFSFIDDLHGLLDYLGIDRVALIGQSMGGRTALGVASIYPERTFLYRGIQRLALDREERDGAGTGLAPTEIKPVIEHEIPTFFIVGEEDSIVPPPALEAMHDKIPHSEFALVPEAGHSVYYERLNLFNRLVVEFLNRYIFG